MTTPLTHDVHTPYGTYATGCPMQIVERFPGVCVVDAGLERWPILLPLPAEAFARKPRQESE